jgi:hypothetical protein
MLLGTHARQEIYPVVGAWIDAHDGARPIAVAEPAPVMAGDG